MTNSYRIHNIFGTNYYLAIDLIKDPLCYKFFNGCKKNVRKCIIKHKIPRSEYVFALQNKNTSLYKIYDAKYKRSDLYLTSRYVKTHIVFDHLNKQLDQNDQIIINNSLSIDKCVNKFPCIYLFSISNIDHHKKMTLLQNSTKKFDQSNLDLINNIYICKYGRTNDLIRRSYEHSKEYNVFTKTDQFMHLNLEVCVYIHPEFLTEAENKIKNYFTLNGYVIKDDLYKELIYLHINDLYKIKVLYKEVADTYNFSYDRLLYQNKIIGLEKSTLEKEIEIITLKNNLKKQ